MAAACFSGPLPAQSEQVLVLNNATNPPLTNEEGTGFLDVIVKKAFRRAGLGLELIKLPAERGLKNANAGIEDGDLIRIAGLEKDYPNLVRVAEKVFVTEFVAFAKDARIVINDWRDLRPYSVAFIKGWKIIENNIPEGTSVTLAHGAGQLFALLEKDRADIVVYSRLMGLDIVKKLGLQGVRDLDPPLARRDMFIYLHRKHGHLAPRIARALADLKAEGAYQDAYRETVAPQLEGTWHE